MPNHKSAKKRVRRNETRRVRNKTYLSAVRSTVKKFLVAVEGLDESIKDAAGLRNLFVQAQTALAKAAQKRILNPNTADRKIGRMANRLKKAEDAGIIGDAKAAAAAKKKTKKKSTKKKKTTKKTAAKKKASKKKK